MADNGLTKITVTKGVNEALKDVLAQARSKISIVSFAEDLLQESIDAMTQPSAPTMTLPTVLKMRARMGLPIWTPPTMEVTYPDADDETPGLRVAETPKHPPPKQQRAR